MKKLRKLLIAAASLMSVSALAGCGNTSVPDDGHLIKVWGTFNDTYQGIIEKAVAKMKQLHPEYTVRYTKQTGMGYDGLAALAVKGFAAGDYPDAIVAYPDSVADFIYAGKALDMKNYINDPEIGWSQEDLDDIPQVYLDEGSDYFIEGTYSLPLCKSTEAMYYNRSILIDLDLSGVDDEINNGDPLDEYYLEHLTWDELFNKLCPALIAYNDKLPESSKILTPSADYADTWALVGYDSDDNLFITLAEQYGLPYTSLNEQTLQGSVDFASVDAQGNCTVSDGYMELMRTFANAYKNKYFTTKGVIGKNVNYVSTTGGMLFSIGSTGGVGYQYSASNPFDVGVAPIPQRVYNKESDLKLINQGPSLAFLKRGTGSVAETRARGAWLFYNIWSSGEINSEWSQTSGYTPIRTSVTKEQSYLDYASLEKKEPATLDILTARNAIYVANTLENLFSSPVFYGSSKARNAVAGIMADIFKGSKTIDVNSSAFESLVKEKFKNAYNNAI